MNDRFHQTDVERAEADDRQERLDVATETLLTHGGTLCGARVEGRLSEPPYSGETTDAQLAYDVSDLIEAGYGAKDLRVLLADRAAFDAALEYLRAKGAA